MAESSSPVLDISIDSSSSVETLSAHMADPRKSRAKQYTEEKKDDAQASKARKQMLRMNPATADMFDRLAQVQPPVPAVNVEFENLTFSIRLPRRPNHVDTVATALAGVATAVSSPPGKVYHVLNNVTGHLRPGTSTLLLAPSGHGKSTLLKALAGRLSPAQLCGNIWYGGQPMRNVNYNRLAAYIGQSDVHLPLLTVSETLQFAHRAWNGGKPLLGDGGVDKVEQMLRILGLQHCRDTVVGNSLIRGISGGEKKRVTFGEMMMANFRVMCMDEISTGLDAAATLDIMKDITRSAELMKCTYLVALLQPAPEVVELFDDIILLREGQIVYHGPQEYMVPFFEEMGLVFFDDTAVADFIVDFLSDPPAVYHRQIQRLQGSSAAPVPPLTTEELVLYFRAQRQRGDWTTTPSLSTKSPRSPAKPLPPLARTGSNPGSSPLASTSSIPGSSDAKAEAKRQPKSQSQSQSPSAAPEGVGEVRNADGSFTVTFATPAPSATPHPLKRANCDRVPPDYHLKVDSDYSQTMYKRSVTYANQGWWEMAMHLFKRQWKVQTRNTAFVAPRLGQAVFMGLLLGSIFFQLSIDDFQLRTGLIFFGCIVLSFSNISELPFAAEMRNVVYKQADARFYTPAAQVASVMLTHLPIATLETILFGSIMYWMCGFANEFSRFLLFLLLLWLLALVASTLFRVFAFVAPNEDTAQTLVGPVVGTSLVFAGFMVTKDKMATALVWVYWLSPFSWLIKALLINEYNSSDYDVIPLGASKRLGDLVLDTFEIENDTKWIWGAIAYFLVLYFGFAWLGVRALTKIRHDSHVGSALVSAEKQYAPTLRRRRLVGGLAASWMTTPTSASLRMPFQKMTVAFRNLTYKVQVKRDGGKQWVQLLHGVNGCATPGTLTALMGASGAGKSTLMDVICGRKTSGERGGEILVNGFVTDHRAFARVMGYVEQTDLLATFATVRETLEFSAALRLSKDVTPPRRATFVNDVLKLLELDHVADQLVGDETTATSISPGQRKRLNIGVELVANPTVLFLDEPTSGLDSRSALSVMRVIKRVALTGRTVVATIHQPSAEIFKKFDNVLLLQKGGHVAYFGPVQGNDGMSAYLESVPGTPKLPPHTNPADWMLAVTGAGVASSAVEPQAYTEHWNKEGAARVPAKVAADEAVEEASRKAPGATALSFDRVYERSLWQQLPIVIRRQVLGAWRNTPLNLTRLLILLVLAFLFGVVFYDLDTSDIAGVNSLNGFAFVGPTFSAVIFMLTSVPVVARERAVFYRERLSNTYSSFAYSTALLFAELPFVIVYPVIFTLISYNLVGLPDDFGIYLHFTLATILMGANFACMGQVLVALVPNKDVAQMLSGTVISVCNLLGGFFLPLPAMAAGVKWTFWINPAGYSYHVIAALLFHCDGADCPSVATVASTGVQVRTISDFMSEQLGFVYEDRWLMTLGAFAWMIGLHLIMALALRFISHLKR